MDKNKCACGKKGFMEIKGTILCEDCYYNGKKRKELKEGVKYDGDKLRTDLIPPECIEAIAYIYTFGAKKYDDNNWRKGMKFSRVYGAILRHLLAWYGGEDNDKETGKSHTWHAAWGCITLVYYMMFHKKYESFDDRIINGGI